MKRTITLLTLSIILFTACNSPEPSPDPVGLNVETMPEEQLDSILTHFNFRYANPQFQDSSDFAIIPLESRVWKSRRGKIMNEIASSGYDSYSTQPDNWNLLFFNTINGEYYLLTKEKIWIDSYSTNIKLGGNIIKNSILYRIIDSDQNGNEILDQMDPAGLFISWQDGSGLKRLSPKEEFLIGYHIIPGTDQIIFSTNRAKPGSKEKDTEYEEIWYKIDLAKDKEASEMVNPDSRQMIKKLFFEQWVQGNQPPEKN